MNIFLRLLMYGLVAYAIYLAHYDHWSQATYWLVFAVWFEYGGRQFDREKSKKK